MFSVDDEVKDCHYASYRLDLIICSWCNKVLKLWN